MCSTRSEHLPTGKQMEHWGSGKKSVCFQRLVWLILLILKPLGFYSNSTILTTCPKALCHFLPSITCTFTWTISFKHVFHSKLCIHPSLKPITKRTLCNSFTIWWPFSVLKELRKMFLLNFQNLVSCSLRYFVTKIYNWMSSVIEYKNEARICPSFLEHRPQSKALKAYLSLQSKICFAQRRPWNQCSRLLMTSIEITAQGHQWWSHKYWWQCISASLRGLRGRKVHHTSYNHILKCESLFFLNEKIELN